MANDNSKGYYKDEQLLAFIRTQIKGMRLSNEISVAVLARECKMDNSQISRMEHGKVNFSTSTL